MPAKKMTEFQETAEEWEDAWAEGQEQGPGGGLPEGEWDTSIQIARVQMTSWGEWQLSIRFEEIKGKGGAWLNLALGGDKDRVRYSASRLKMLGYVGPMKDVEAAAESGMFDDLYCRISVKAKVKDDKVYMNTYLNEVHGSNPNPTTGDEDIPF